jgi:hypothetical protein
LHAFVTVEFKGVVYQWRPLFHGNPAARAAAEHSHMHMNSHSHNHCQRSPLDVSTADFSSQRSSSAVAHCLSRAFSAGDGGDSNREVKMEVAVILGVIHLWGQHIHIACQSKALIL